MKWLVASIAIAVMGAGAAAFADDAAPPPPPAPASQHQMMKDCMAKQKASESGIPKEEMKKNCKDVTKTEKQNADKPAAPAAPVNN